MYDLIIVGAGPAGLTAAIYARRSNKSVLILEKKNYGGQIINANKIDNYPGLPGISGVDYASILYNQVMSLGVSFKYEEVINIDKEKNVTTHKNVYQAKAIIIAIGKENKKLKLENEDEYLGKGISYCAICDGNFFRNKNVAVIGGGNTAVNDAIYLSDIALNVYLINQKDSFKVDKKYIDELQTKSNVKCIFNSTVSQVYGNNILESIDIIDNAGIKNNLKVNGLFVAIGQIPASVIFSNLIKVDKNGYIESVDGVHTNIDGIYVAGDVRVKELRQLVTAVSDGAMAATIAIKEMRKDYENYGN